MLSLAAQIHLFQRLVHLSLLLDDAADTVPHSLVLLEVVGSEHQSQTNLRFLDQ